MTSNNVKEGVIELLLTFGIIDDNSIKSVDLRDITQCDITKLKNESAKILVDHIKKYENINNEYELDLYSFIFVIIYICKDKKLLDFDENTKNIVQNISMSFMLGTPIITERKPGINHEVTNSNNVLVNYHGIHNIKIKYLKIKHIDDIFRYIDFLLKPKIIRENILRQYMNDEYHTLLSNVMDNYKKCRTESDYKLYIGKYGYTVPTDVMINKMIEFIDNRSVLEIGAGYGLVSYLLKLKGVNIIATDACCGVTHIYNRGNYLDPSAVTNTKHFYIQDHVQGYVKHNEAFKKYPECEILLMIWPSYDDLNIDEFKGKHIIFIGTDFNTPCNYEHFFNRVRESNFQQYIDQTIYYPIKSPFFTSLQDKLIFYDKI